MKKLLFIFTFFSLLAVCSLQAQNRSISGKIIDDSGETLIGVNIIEKGTINGTASDVDGSYALSVSEGSTLVFSYTGYTKIEKSFKGKKPLTTCKITKAGSKAFEEYVAALQHYIKK